ncbi:MAG: hypothetical protein UW94_C0013G0016 [Parcubacteria group bacterium GW2011_GWA2_45_14]|nr:MAG: hypothetical protein UW94_C0013G0016 [Parcubacteria group bacterium GW2011_GWA2_45_14]
MRLVSLDQNYSNMSRSLFRLQLPRPTGYGLIVTVFALVPFAVRIGFILTGVTGYILHSAYKIFQLLIPIGWRYRNKQLRGWRILWPGGLFGRVY